MKEEALIIAALQQARMNMSQAAFDEDYGEANVWQIKIEALEDLMLEVHALKQDNVVNIHG